MISLANKGTCIQSYNRQQVAIAVATENGKTFHLRNRAPRWTITNYKGECLAPPRTEACDFLFLLEKQRSKVAYLVELKGSDVAKAASQILSTLNFLQIRTTSDFDSVKGRIIPTRNSVPEIRSTEYKKLKAVLSSLNGDLIVQSSQREDVV